MSFKTLSEIVLWEREAKARAKLKGGIVTQVYDASFQSTFTRSPGTLRSYPTKTVAALDFHPAV